MSNKLSYQPMIWVRFILILPLLMLVIPPSIAQETEQTEVELERLVFWSTEFQPVKVARQQALIDQFEAAHPNTQIELVVLDEILIDQMMLLTDQAAALPDLVLHPLSLTSRWEQRGYLDVDYSNRMVETLGLETFAQGALGLNRLEDGRYAAIPSDGWELLIVYRRDWFEANELKAPSTFENIRLAGEALHDPDNGQYGVCIPTHLEDSFTWQVFEQMAIANGAQVYDENGNLTVESPAFLSAVEFYIEVVRNYSQLALGWDTVNVEEAYLAGECGMMFAASSMMTDIAGLNEFRLPSCPECHDNLGFLAENSGFISLLQGDTEDAIAVARGEINNLGLGRGASERAADFILFYFNDGYLEWLAADPQVKLPMRRGDRNDEDRFVQGWSDLVIGFDHRVPLRELFPENELRAVIDGATRYRRLGLEQQRLPLLPALQDQKFVQQNLLLAAFGNTPSEEVLANISDEIRTLTNSLLQ